MKTLKCFFAVVRVLCSAPGAQAQSQRLQDSTLALLGVWTTGPCNAVAAESIFVYIAKASTLEILDVSGGVASGVYFYHLSVVPLARRDLVPTDARDGQAGDLVKTMKLIVMRPAEGSFAACVHPAARRQ